MASPVECAASTSLCRVPLGDLIRSERTATPLRRLGRSASITPSAASYGGRRPLIGRPHPLNASIQVVYHLIHDSGYEFVIIMTVSLRRRKESPPCLRYSCAPVTPTVRPPLTAVIPSLAKDLLFSNSADASTQFARGPQYSALQPPASRNRAETLRSLPRL